jgi:hypothetical protein
VSTASGDSFEVLESPSWLLWPKSRLSSSTSPLLLVPEWSEFCKDSSSGAAHSFTDATDPSKTECSTEMTGINRSSSSASLALDKMNGESSVDIGDDDYVVGDEVVADADGLLIIHSLLDLAQG